MNDPNKNNNFQNFPFTWSFRYSENRNLSAVMSFLSLKRETIEMNEQLNDFIKILVFDNYDSFVVTVMHSL